MVKKRYDGNEILGLAWDRIELCRMPLFITTAAAKNCQANLSNQRKKGKESPSEAANGGVL